MEHLIKLLVSGDITRENLEEYSRVKSLSIVEIYNQLSLEIARRYDSGLLSFTDADWAMNNINPFWIDDAVKFGDGFVLPEPADSIYLAFDAGEWDRGDGKDPEIEFTKPLIRKILENA
jgi:hypothetical protein